MFVCIQNEIEEVRRMKKPSGLGRDMREMMEKKKKKKKKVLENSEKTVNVL